MVAGRAAHAGSREESALEFYRVAESLAENPRRTRDALWGQLAAASSLEMDEAHQLVERLENSLSRSDQYELVRMADRKLGIDSRFGVITSLANARRVAELVPYLDDPFARCSFRSVFASVLVLNAAYEEAHKQALLLHDDATEFRVDVALPYAHLVLAYALAGLGRHTDAHLAIDNGTREARRCNDDYGLQNFYACRVRILVQQGRGIEACALELPDLGHSVPSILGEVLSVRGLALATIGRFAEARSMGERASVASKAVETRVLVAAIGALCDLRERTSHMRASVDSFMYAGMDSGGIDLVVTAYRGNPDLLEALLASETTREQTTHVVTRAGDADLLVAAGLEPASLYDPLKSLSRREHDVYELLCDGLGNAEIGQRLFITEGTVKVHVHHIFDKLGVRSRTALAINAARRR